MKKQDKKTKEFIKHAEEYFKSQFNIEFDKARRMAINDVITYGFVTEETQALIEKLKTK